MKTLLFFVNVGTFVYTMFQIRMHRVDGAQPMNYEIKHSKQLPRIACVYKTSA